MTGFILDTPVLLAFLSGKTEKMPELHTILQDLSVPVYASAASIFETAVKKAMKRIQIPDHFPDAIVQSGLEVLPLDGDTAWRTLRLPFHHSDPFDRLLLSQAKAGNLTILTQNPVFQRYDVRVEMV